MSIGRGAYQSGLWLTGKAWVYLDKALVLLSFCPYLESLELQMTQLSSSETQLTKSLSYSRPPFSCLQKCLGLGALWDCPQHPVGILHMGANVALGTKQYLPGESSWAHHGPHLNLALYLASCPHLTGRAQSDLFQARAGW